MTRPDRLKRIDELTAEMVEVSTFNLGRTQGIVAEALELIGDELRELHAKQEALELKVVT